MATTPSTRWGKLSNLEQVSQVGQISEILGETPEVHASETKPPAYLPGVFQVWVRPDGVWIHACLLRRWRRRQMRRLLAESEYVPFAREYAAWCAQRAG